MLSCETKWIDCSALAGLDETEGTVDVVITHDARIITQSVRRAQAIQVKVIRDRSPALGDRPCVEHRLGRVDHLGYISLVGLQEDVLPVPEELRRPGGVVLADALGVAV